MLKLTLDISSLKNNIAVIKNDAFTALSGTDKDRRDALAKIIEKLKTLEQRACSPELEIK